MNTITIEISKLLPIVIDNKLKHDTIYNVAVSGYWAKAEEVLTYKLDQVKKQEKIENNLGLSYPVNYEDDYNRVIRMLELTSDTKVELTQNEFDSYVRNQWSWKTNFLETNSNYLTGCYIASGMMFGK